MNEKLNCLQYPTFTWSKWRMPVFGLCVTGSIHSFALTPSHQQQ